MSACLGGALAVRPDALELVTETVEIPFEKQTRYDSQLRTGQSEIVQKGKSGVQERTYEVYSVAGETLSKVQVRTDMIEAPVAQVVRVGSKPTVPTPAASQAKATPTPKPTTPPTVKPTARPTTAPVAQPTRAPKPTVAPKPTTAPKPTARPTKEPTVQPTPKPTSGSPAVANSSFGFVKPAKKAQAVANFAKIKGLINRNGNKNYRTFTRNNDKTITVDGVRLRYDSVTKRTITHYDGMEVCMHIGDHKPLINHNVACGIPAQRGIVATGLGGYPYGTVLFVENYGLAVVADRHGIRSNPFLVDCAFDAGETLRGEAKIGKKHWNVYVISIP